ncbi:hypothetical protein [Jongsikchunia kroppenstedtii]|uniref:hypothetical protein n=1 Tax=Jongsikchunia kroppenstedtii TaxID=1121721 RepID=UPI00037A6A9F|nr:hypothetical protein [Jongsikchunia kroppenstedtii]
MAESAPPSRRALLAAERAARREVVAAERELAELNPADGAAESPASSGRWWPVVAVAAIVIAVAVAVAGTVRFSQLDSETFSDSQVRSAAVDRVELLLTPNMHDPGQSKRILDDSTGAFHDQFAQASDAYTKFVAAVGTVATGQVDGTAIETRDRRSATVLVTAGIAVRTTTGDGAGNKRFRLRVQLQPDGGELKLAAVELVS